MTDELERRWDDAIEQAWVELRRRVADRLASLAEGDTFLLEMPDDEDATGATPYCQVLTGPGVLRVEAVSNTFLADECQLDDDQEACLRGLGFEAPAEEGSANFWVDLEQREADRVAWMMVEALRTVYAVLHPAYLNTDELDAVTDPAAAEPEHEPLTYSPQDADEVRSCVSRVVRDLLGHDPEWDEDGDLPLQTNRGVLYVTVAQKSPRLLLHSTVVVDVEDEQRALREVNVLNRREFGLTFLVNEGRVCVRRELPVSRFVDEEVRVEIERICDNLDQWVTDLVDRVGGRGVFDDEPARRAAVPQDEGRDRFQQALRVLHELEKEERGSVDPATMVRIFHADRGLLLRAIRDTNARATRVDKHRRKCEAEGKPRTAAVCRSLHRYQLELRGRLRHALRLVVQAPLKVEPEAQLSLFTEDEASA